MSLDHRKASLDPVPVPLFFLLCLPQSHVGQRLQHLCLRRSLPNEDVLVFSSTGKVMPKSRRLLGESYSRGFLIHIWNIIFIILTTFRCTVQQCYVYSHCCISLASWHFFPSLFQKLKSFLHISAVFYFQNYKNNAGIYVTYKDFKIRKYTRLQHKSPTILYLIQPTLSHLLAQSYSFHNSSYVELMESFLYIYAYVCTHIYIL